MLENILKEYPRQEDYLIEVLLEYQKQKADRHIGEDEIRRIAEYLGVTESKVWSVITFYTFFSTRPRGENIIQICKDVPCYLNDGNTVQRTLEQLLGVQVGETTKNQKFTLEHTSCLGHCDGAPAIRINDKTYTNLSVDKLKAIISEYRGNT